MSRRMLPLFLAGLLAVGLLPACSVSDKTVTATITEPVTKVVVRSDTGAVRVVGGVAGQITLRRKLHFRGKKPELVQSVVDGVLTVSSQCKGGALSQCSVTEEVDVPADVVVEASTTGDGDVSLEKLTADSTASTDKGDVKATRLGGKVTISTGAGDVDLDGLSNDVTVKTVAGAVKGTSLSTLKVDATTEAKGKVSLAFDRPPDQVNVHTADGAIDIEVPKAAYQVAPRTSGKITIAGTQGKDANGRQINATSGTGNVTVEGK